MLPNPFQHRAGIAFPDLSLAALAILLLLGMAPCRGESASAADPVVTAASSSAAPATAEDPLLTLAQRLVRPSSEVVPDAGEPWVHSPASEGQAPGAASMVRAADQLPLGPRASVAPSPHNAAGAPPPGPSLWSMGSVAQTLAALALVLGLVFLMRWFLRQWAGQGAVAATGSNSGKVVEVLARALVSQKSSILVLRLGHRLLVVNDTPTGMNTLATIQDPDEIATMLNLIHADKPGSISGQFRQMLDHFNGKYAGQLHPELPRTLADLDDPGGDETEIVTDRSRDEVSSLLARLRRMSVEVGRS